MANNSRCKMMSLVTAASPTPQQKLTDHDRKRRITPIPNLGCIPCEAAYAGCRRIRRVGEVQCVGSSVKDLSFGDWVIRFPPSSGRLQSYTVKDQSVWHKINKDTPPKYAATVTVKPLTAFRMLDDFVKLNPGDSIVQNGATSMVGQCVIQLARQQGVHSINIIWDRTIASKSDSTEKENKDPGSSRFQDF